MTPCLRCRQGNKHTWGETKPRGENSNNLTPPLHTQESAKGIPSDARIVAPSSPQGREGLRTAILVGIPAALMNTCTGWVGDATLPGLRGAVLSNVLEAKKNVSARLVRN